MFNCFKNTLGVILISAASMFAQSNGDNANAQPYVAPQAPPQQGYNQIYAVPQQNYNQVYAVPQQNYNQVYAVPQQSYGQVYVVPQQGYGQVYAVPQPSYNQVYAVPPQNYNQANYNQANVPPPPEEKKKTGRTLQTLNFVIPFENETWDVDDRDADWSSIGYEFNWSRYRIGDNKLSSAFGLSLGYVAGDIKNNTWGEANMDGLDFNLKFGWGMAPATDNLIVAFHVLMGFDIKVLEGDNGKTSNTETNGYNTVSTTTTNTESIEYSADYIDFILGGDLVLAYLFNDAFAIVGGIDVTTNVLGVGIYSYELSFRRHSDFFTYMFTGVNIAPRVGIAFIF